MQNYKSYTELIKDWRAVKEVNQDSFKDVIARLNLVQEEDFEYHKLPLQVSYQVVPVVLGGILNVKIVVIGQGESIALIVPDNLSSIYEAVAEDPESITQLNIGIELLVETFGFDTTDPAFTDLVKDVYLGANNSSPAFTLTNAGAVLSTEEKESEEEDRSVGTLDRGIDKPLEKEPENFTEPVVSTEDEDITPNLEAYRSFATETGALQKLMEHITTLKPFTLRENIKASFLTSENNVAVIKVNNKDIYNQYINVPKKAKELISSVGESIRENKDVQILDTYQKDGGRIFVIAEANNKNYWYAKGDNIVSKEGLSESKGTLKIVVPRKPIKLEKTSVRMESRRFTPVLHNKKLAFAINK